MVVYLLIQQIYVENKNTSKKYSIPDTCLKVKLKQPAYSHLCDVQIRVIVNSKGQFNLFNFNMKKIMFTNNARACKLTIHHKIPFKSFRKMSLKMTIDSRLSLVAFYIRLYLNPALNRRTELK